MRRPCTQVRPQSSGLEPCARGLSQTLTQGAMRCCRVGPSKQGLHHQSCAGVFGLGRTWVDGDGASQVFCAFPFSGIKKTGGRHEYNRVRGTSLHDRQTSPYVAAACSIGLWTVPAVWVVLILLLLLAGCPLAPVPFCCGETCPMRFQVDMGSADYKHCSLGGYPS